MKHIQIFVISLIVISCSNENKPDMTINSKAMTENEINCIDELYHEIDSSNFKAYKKNTSKNKWEIYQSIDSLNFDIIKRWRRDYRPIYESTRNTNNNIELCKEYHENGVLRSQGYMTSFYGTPIGIWNFYSSKGNLDSTVNYDRLYGLSFCEFYKICKQRHFIGKYSSIEFLNKEKKWRIEKNEDVNGSPISTGIELQIDSKIVREFSLKGIY